MLNPIKCIKMSPRAAHTRPQLSTGRKSVFFKHFKCQCCGFVKSLAGGRSNRTDGDSQLFPVFSLFYSHMENSCFVKPSLVSHRAMWHRAVTEQHCPPFTSASFHALRTLWTTINLEDTRIGTSLCSLNH